jgi:hypothetical protein
MRHSFLIATISLAGSAAAQPVDPPPLVEVRPCAVTIVRAPDDVRRAIEEWVQRETSCSIALDVRAIPTDGGLYLLARESTGRLHERLVPDAQAAGVLVASWVANDSLEPTPPPPALLVPAPAAPFAVPPTDLILRSPSCDGIACGRSRRGGGWGLGVTLLPNDISGARLRGEIDLVRASNFAAGLVFAGATAVADNMDPFYEHARRADGRALGAVSLTLHEGTVVARLQGAVGAVWSHVFKDQPKGVFAADWHALAFEASLMVGFRMSDEWLVGIAPVATGYAATGARDPEASLGGGDFGVLLELRRGP